MDEQTKEFFDKNFIQIINVNHVFAENPMSFKSRLARYIGIGEGSVGSNEILNIGIMIFVCDQDEYVASYSDKHVENYCSQKERVIISADNLDSEKLGEKVLRTIQDYYCVDIELL